MTSESATAVPGAQPVPTGAADQILRIGETGDMPMTARLHKVFAPASANECFQEMCTIRLTVLDNRGLPHFVPIRQYLLRNPSTAPPADGQSEDGPRSE